MIVTYDQVRRLSHFRLSQRSLFLTTGTYLRYSVSKLVSTETYLNRFLHLTFPTEKVAVMRQLKYHEYRLLKKADFLQWKREHSQRELTVVRRYRLSNPEDYHKYSKIVGEVRHLAHLLEQLEKNDQVRVQRTEDLLKKLYDMGVIHVKSGLNACAKVTVSALCRRRLPVVLVRLHFAESLQEAVTLIEQGHIRVGPSVVKDQAMLVTRNMEDFITWVDSSKIKRKVAAYNDELDDYDLLNA